MFFVFVFVFLFCFCAVHNQSKQTCVLVVYTVAKVSPLEAFDFSMYAAWPARKHSFLRFCTISKLDKEDEDCQVRTLLYSMGPDADTVLEQLEFDDPADATKWKNR